MPKRGIQEDQLRRQVAGPAKQGSVYKRTVPGVSGSGESTLPLEVNTVNYMPFYVEHAMSVDQLACRVDSVGAGSTTARLGIYHADDGWQPTALVVDGGTVATDSGGVKTVTIDEVLYPGRYLFAVNSDGTASLNAVDAVNLSWGQILNSPVSGISLVQQWQGSQTYGAFPDPGDAWTSAVSSAVGFKYAIWMRVAAQ